MEKENQITNYLRYLPTGRWRSSLFAIASAYLSILGTGCNDLAQVREFAVTSSQPDVYKQIVGEYAKSADRQKPYVEFSRHDDLDKVTAKRVSQVNGLLAMQQALGSYMQMVGRLADDKVTDIEEANKGIKSGLSSLSGDLKLTATQVTLMGKIVDLVSKASIEGYRQRELGSILKEADKSIAALTSQMRFVSGKAVKEALGNEMAAMDKRYKAVLLTIQDPNNPLYLDKSREWHQNRSELLNKQRACDEYGACLEKIAKAHHELAGSADKVSRKELASLASSYKDQVKSLYDTAKDLLK